MTKMGDIEKLLMLRLGKFSQNRSHIALRLESNSWVFVFTYAIFKYLLWSICITIL